VVALVFCSGRLGSEREYLLAKSVLIHYDGVIQMRTVDKGNLHGLYLCFVLSIGTLSHTTTSS
jgi:hypothetical protein